MENKNEKEKRKVLRHFLFDNVSSVATLIVESTKLQC